MVLKCEIEFNVRFTGSYELLKWVIKKYKNELPYCGSILNYGKKNHYSEKNLSFFWKRNGVPVRAWNQLHKDLVMARLIGRIKDKDVKSLEELGGEFGDE